MIRCRQILMDAKKSLRYFQNRRNSVMAEKVKKDKQANDFLKRVAESYMYSYED